MLIHHDSSEINPGTSAERVYSKTLPVISDAKMQAKRFLAGIHVQHQLMTLALCHFIRDTMSRRISITRGKIGASNRRSKTSHQQPHTRNTATAKHINTHADLPISTGLRCVLYLLYGQILDVRPEKPHTNRTMAQVFTNNAVMWGRRDISNGAMALFGHQKICKIRWHKKARFAVTWWSKGSRSYPRSLEKLHVKFLWNLQSRYDDQCRIKKMWYILILYDSDLNWFFGWWHDNDW